MINSSSSFCVLSQIIRPALGILMVAFLIFQTCGDAAETGSPPARWPPLAEVLKRWDSVNWNEVVEKAKEGDLTARHYLGYCCCEGHRIEQNSAVGIGWYEHAGTNGYLPSLSNIGVLYFHGKGVPQDYEKSLRWFQRAADAGYVPALNYVGNFYRDGSGVKPDATKAMEWYRRASEQGNSTGDSELGRGYRLGAGVPKDLQKAESLFRRSADAGNALGMLNLAMLYDEDEARYDEAARFYRQAAEKGNSHAMFKLFLLYRNGLMEDQNKDDALRWLTEAAEAGHSSAQRELGWHYESPDYDASLPNHSIPRNPPEAFKWYQRSASQGDSAGLFCLARCYLSGFGVEVNEEKGLDYMRQSADKGNIHGMQNLAELYSQGVGGPRNEQDRPLAILLRVARADHLSVHLREGNREPFPTIIFRYQFGVGTERDLIAAAEWYCRAALAGAWSYSIQDKLDPFPARPGNTVSYTSAPGHDAVNLRLPGPDDQFRQVLAGYLKVATGNHVEEAMRLSRMCRDGRNTPRNRVNAAVWLFLAQQQSTDGSAQDPELESRLSADDIAEAKRQLRELMRHLKNVAREIQNESGNG